MRSVLLQQIYTAGTNASGLVRGVGLVTEVVFIQGSTQYLVQPTKS